jgi:hypothetical protein
MVAVDAYIPRGRSARIGCKAGRDKDGRWTPSGRAAHARIRTYVNDLEIARSSPLRVLVCNSPFKREVSRPGAAPWIEGGRTLDVRRP